MLQNHLEKLIHFVGVVKSGSIRGYSIKNRLSQPSISKTIQNLEGILETTLLVRNQHGINLTPAGGELYEWAEKILSETNEIESSIRSKGSVRLKGKIRMGAYQSIGVYFVPSFFKFLQKSQSALQIELLTASSVELISAVKSGKIDFCISVNPPSSRELYRQELFKDTFSLFRKKETSLNSSTTPIYGFGAAVDLSGKRVLDHVDSAGLRKRFCECGDFETAKAMLLADAGYAILPNNVASSFAINGSISRVTEYPKLQNFGPHSIEFSCKKTRSSETSLKWVAEQLELLLKSESKKSQR